MQVVTTHSPEETFELGRRLGQSIHSSTVILLEGDLGTGKTTFTKGLAAGLDIDPDEVRSPSFILLCEYEGRMKLYHVDLYRLDNPRDINTHLGLDEVLNEEAVTVIEWADKLKQPRFETGIRVRLIWIDESSRKITVERGDQQDAVGGGSG